MRLLSHCVLVCEDCAGGREKAGRRGYGILRVDCGHDGEEVLEFVEVVGGRFDSAVEGVEERGVEGAEGKLGDYVGEVEC